MPNALTHDRFQSIGVATLTRAFSNARAAEEWRTGRNRAVYRVRRTTRKAVPAR
jgi:hypothetical protein